MEITLLDGAKQYWVWAHEGPGFCNRILQRQFVGGILPTPVDGVIAQALVDRGFHVTEYELGSRVDKWITPPPDATNFTCTFVLDGDSEALAKMTLARDEAVALARVALQEVDEAKKAAAIAYENAAGAVVSDRKALDLESKCTKLEKALAKYTDAALPPISAKQMKAPPSKLPADYAKLFLQYTAGGNLRKG